MRPTPTYVDPLSPSRQEGHSQRIFQSYAGEITEHLFGWWRRTRSLTAGDALCRAGANLGNWNDRVHGQQTVTTMAGQLRVERTLRWHVIGRVADWLYVAPERRS